MKISMNFKSFISFEGIDFCGKSTQIKLLTEKLSEVEIYPLILREPGGTVVSEKIREILLNSEYREMHSKTEILLYEAARAQLVHQKIIPQLKSGSYVIADRFFDSTTTYQGFGRSLDLKFVEQLNSFATSSLKPHKTIFIDVSPETAEKRRIRNSYQQDRLESSGLEFFKSIREGFLSICGKEPERFIKIDGEREINEIAGEIWQIVENLWIKN